MNENEMQMMSPAAKRVIYDHPQMSLSLCLPLASPDVKQAVSHRGKTTYKHDEGRFADEC